MKLKINEMYICEDNQFTDWYGAPVIFIGYEGEGKCALIRDIFSGERHVIFCDKLSYVRPGMRAALDRFFRAINRLREVHVDITNALEGLK